MKGLAILAQPTSRRQLQEDDENGLGVSDLPHSNEYSQKDVETLNQLIRRDVLVPHLTAPRQSSKPEHTLDDNTSLLTHERFEFRLLSGVLPRKVSLWPKPLDPR
jgi:hypothetical protein